MTSLIRTKQGKFDIKDSFTIEDIKNNNYKILSIEEVLDLDIVTSSDNLFKLIDNGVSIDYKSKKDYILFRYNFDDIALYKKEKDGKYHMYIKLNN
jgi:tRNA U55 pseudouridine synthase TruB